MTLDVEPLVDEIESAHLIHPILETEPTYLFNHALVQETAYNSLLVKGRREYHRQAAAAIEQVYAANLDEHAFALAYHYWRGDDWHKAAEYARRAGDRAMRVYGLREAIGDYAQALQAMDRLPDAPAQDLCDIILGWAEAAFAFEPYSLQLQQLARAEKLARDLNDKQRLARVLHTTGKVYIASGYPFRAVEPLVECFALATELGDEKLSVVPTLYMGYATYDTDPRRALGWFARAIELARRYEDIDTEAYALSGKALVEARLGEAADCRRDVDQALQLVPQIKSPMCDSDVHLYSAWAFLDLEDVSRGLEYAKLGVQKTVTADNMQCACTAYACLGFGHLRAEQVDEAVRAFEEAIRRSQVSGAVVAEVLGEMGLAITRLLSGDPEGIQQLEHAYEHAQQINEVFVSALLAQTLGETYLNQGNVDMALTRLDAALDYYRRHRMRPYLSRTLELYAAALERCGQTDKANQARAERAELT